MRESIFIRVELKKLKKKLEIEKYLTGQFTMEQVWEIIDGLENGVDVTVYAKPEFDDRQMHAIRLGLEYNVDISIYAKPIYNGGQMIDLFIGLIENLDVSIIANPNYDEMEMILDVLRGYEVSPLDERFKHFFVHLDEYKHLLPQERLK